MPLFDALQNFEILFEDELGINYLQQLIIDAAVEGKLYNDLGLNCLDSKVTAIPEEDQLITIPSNWMCTELGNTGRIFNGESTSEVVKKRLATNKVGIPYLATKDISYGGDNIDYETGLNVEFDNTNFKRAKAGSILICLEGGSAGRKMGVVDRTVCFGNKLFANEVFDGINPRYLLLVYRSSSFQNQFKSKVNGIIGGISKRNFMAIQCPIPPLPVQNAIVKEVENLLLLCAELRDSKKNKVLLGRRLVRSLINQLLASQSSVDYSQHLNSLLDNLSFLLSKTEDLDSFRGFLFSIVNRKFCLDITDNLVRTKLGDHLNFLNGYAFKSDWYKSTGIPLVRGQNIAHGYLDWADSKYLDISRKDEFKRFLLKADDIVLALDRPIISSGLKIARLRESDCPSLLLQRVAKITCNSLYLDYEYLWLWLNSNLFIGQLDPGRSNGVPHISTKQIAAIPIDIPPIETQKVIVHEIARIEAVILELSKNLLMIDDRRKRLVSV